MMLDGVDVDRPAVHGEAAARHLIVEEVLRRVFLPAQRGIAHQVLRQLHLIGETGIDGGDDVVRELGIEHGYLPANVSVAVMSWLRMPGSSKAWPASSTMWNAASGQARCRSHAVVAGVQTS